MVRTITLSLVALLAATTVGCAEAPMTMLPVRTARPVAQAAAANPVAQQLKWMDTNKNGTLSEKEYVDGRFGEMRFFRAPTAAEVTSLKAGLAKTFAKLDTNKDARLTLAEFAKDFAAL